MQNKEKRIEFWDKHYKTMCQGPSIVCPFVNDIKLFSDKDVLEIGPGEGRQFFLVKDISKNYSVADICSKVIEQDIFNNCSERYIINDYSINFNKSFDIIHCWYVIHHILLEEIGLFFNLVYTHLKTQGYFLFNYPNNGNIQKNVYVENNGMKTTPFEEDNLLQLLSKYFSVISIKHMENNCVYVKAIKKENQ